MNVQFWEQRIMTVQFWAVLREDFDRELHSVWGPFASEPDAIAWRDRQPDSGSLLVERLIAPEIERKDGD